ncbi:hypothetical protein D3C86_1688970 [compost metagenome]
MCGGKRQGAAVAQLLDGALDLFGGFAGPGREAAHLIGDHRETASGLSGTGRFDGRVQRQQVGLFGDAANHMRDTADGFDRLRQVADRLTDLLDRSAQAGHRTLALPGHPVAFAGQAIHGLSGLGRVLQVARQLLDRRTHLMDRRGGLLGFLELPLQVTRLGLHQRR